MCHLRGRFRKKAEPSAMPLWAKAGKTTGAVGGFVFYVEPDLQWSYCSGGVVSPAWCRLVHFRSPFCGRPLCVRRSRVAARNGANHRALSTNRNTEFINCSGARSWVCAFLLLSCPATLPAAPFTGVTFSPPFAPPNWCSDANEN